MAGEGTFIANLTAATVAAAALLLRIECAQGRVMVSTVIAMVQSVYMGRPLEGDCGNIELNCEK